MFSTASNSNVENLCPQVLKQVGRDIGDLVKNPLDGIRVFSNDSDITDIRCAIDGPVDTPFEGGVFRVRLVLGKDFPQVPPKGFFLTKIFHPNVANNGEICVNTLKRDWSPTLGLRHIFLTVKCLLIHPNPESALNEDAGKLLLEDYQCYWERAKLMTEIHAKPTKTKANDDLEVGSQLATTSSGNGPPCAKKLASVSGAAVCSSGERDCHSEVVGSQISSSAADKKRLKERKRMFKRL